MFRGNHDDFLFSINILKAFKLVKKFLRKWTGVKFHGCRRERFICGEKLRSSWVMGVECWVRGAG